MPSVLSTKKLQLNQRELLLNAGCSFVEYDAITTEPIPFEFPKDIENIIITSQNGAAQYLTQKVFVGQCFVVGKKTAALLANKGLKVIEIAQNSAELAHFIAKNYKNERFHYFCGDKRRDELPTILKEAKVSFKEVVSYETSLNIRSFEQTFDGVLFFSPSGVEAFAKANTLKNTTAFCIGNTTAAEAKKYTNHTVVSNATSVESTIAKAVNHLKMVSK